MKKGIVTEYNQSCMFCGREAESQHHLLFGTGDRRLAEQDGLKVPICNTCHNMGSTQESIHGNSKAEALSKMLGQAIFENKIGSREDFRNRYGKSYF